MIERGSSGFGKSPPLMVLNAARLWRMSPGRATRTAFAAGLGFSAILTTSSTVPALLECANLTPPDAGGYDGATYDGAPLRKFAEAPPTPAGLIVEYSPASPRLGGAEPYGGGVPFAVRSSSLADDQVLTEVPGFVVPSDALADQGSWGRASLSKAPRRGRWAAASAARARKDSSPRATGCSQCPGPVVYRSHSPPNFLASLFSGNVFRKGRPARRESRPTGVAQQRAAPRLTAWAFRPG